MRRVSPFALAAYITLFGLVGARSETTIPTPERSHHIRWDGERHYHRPKHGSKGREMTELKLNVDWRIAHRKSLGDPLFRTESPLQRRAQRMARRYGVTGMCPPNSDLANPPGSGGSNPTVISLTSTGSAATGIGYYGPNSVGAGLSPLTPAGVKTTTGGFNELQDYLKSIGGGVMEVTTQVSGKGQFVFRNGVTVRGNNYLIANTNTNALMPIPFITDVDVAMANKSDLLGLNLSAGSVARTDTIINAPGATTIGASPYTYTNNTPGYTLVAVLDGTVSAITTGGNACPNAYGIFAVAPGTSLVVTYTAGAGTTPTVVLIGAGVAFGPGNTNNFDVTLAGTNGGNGMHGCGWVSPAGTDLLNNYSNHYITLGVLSTTGLFAFRFMGAGGGNNDAFVDNDIDFLYAQGFAAGGVNPGFGIIWSYHTDSNRVGMTFLVPNSAAAAGSYDVAFNDAYFNAAGTDVKVNANHIEWLLATPNAAGTNCNVVLANASGLTAGSGGSNGVTRFERVGTLTTPVVIQNGGIFSGHDATVGHVADWNLSQLNQLGTTPSTTLYTQSGAPTASTTIIAAGINKTFVPNYTGNVLVLAIGTAGTATAVAKASVGLYRNTSASTAGNVWTGATVVGSQKTVAAGSAGSNTGVVCGGIVTGLVIGTTYYFDLQYYTSSATDTASLTNFDFIIIELAA